MTNKGIAYILYTRPSYAEAAVAHMHEGQLDGAVISVSMVLPRRRLSPSPSPPRRFAGGYPDPYRAGPPAHGWRNGGHLTKNVHQPHLHEIFSTYGEIESLELPLNRHLMTNKGIAYILYTRPSYAEAAVAHMHEGQLDGAVISVSMVLPRRRLSPSPSPPRRFAGGYPDPYRAGPPAHGWRNGGDSNRPDALYANWRGRGGPSRRGGRGRYRDRIDDRRSYRPGPGPRRDLPPSRSWSRSRSPRRDRRYSNRSRSSSRGRVSPPPPRYRRRSPSYSTYGSRSRSRDRNRGQGGRGY
nr:rna-binding protein with serine-rich domain 1 [Quercus suber]